MTKSVSAVQGASEERCRNCGFTKAHHSNVQGWCIINFRTKWAVQGKPIETRCDCSVASDLPHLLCPVHGPRKLVEGKEEPSAPTLQQVISVLEWASAGDWEHAMDCVKEALSLLASPSVQTQEPK
jgi:hypothetical protein